MFNLTSFRHFNSKANQGGIKCSSARGPSFCGEDDSELSALNEPFNGDSKCVSNANQAGYEIKTNEDGINMLTNMKDGKFKIIELEVWQVEFKE